MRFIATIIFIMALVAPTLAQAPDNKAEKPAPVVMTVVEAEAFAEAQGQLAAAGDAKRQIELGVSKGFATLASLERAAAAEEMWRFYVETLRLKVLLRASGGDPKTQVIPPPKPEAAKP